MADTAFMMVENGEAVDLKTLPKVSFQTFRGALIAALNSGARLSAMPVRQPPGKKTLQVIGVLAFPARAEVGLLSAEMPERWPSLTPDCPAAHWFEREITEQWGIVPDGHPWLKPIRFERPYRSRPDGCKHPAIPTRRDFFKIQGDESHEVAVGPVHAGVIEPGHFRFLCHGETVHHLEISLGYQHRGVERAMIGGPGLRSIHYMETLAGDTTIGHATAYCRIMETLTGTKASARAEAIRAIASELERIANHIGDLGALAGDVGFLPTRDYCGRIRGDVLNITAALCGNRFGRGLVVPAGVGWDMDNRLADTISDRLTNVQKDITGAVTLLFDAPSVLARFEGTGAVDADTARRVGLVGVAARACGLDLDVRHEFPYGMYRLAQLPPNTWHTGDCFARAYVRWIEVRASLEYVLHLLRELPTGDIRRDPGATGADTLAFSLVEGWRGEICHVAATDREGRFAFYKVVDPSFHNWFGLALSMRGRQISDFPLCNKSFNLSYCGHDL